MLEGACFCGFIRYQARGTPSNETNCHCSICRRSSGAPYVTCTNRLTILLVNGFF